MRESEDKWEELKTKLQCYTCTYLYLSILSLFTIPVIGGRKGEIETNRKGRKKR